MGTALNFEEEIMEFENSNENEDSLAEQLIQRER